MNVIAINGSPRKKANTATVLQNCLDGAASGGASTEMVHLYSLSFKGCISCFACKRLGGKSYGRCAVQDDLAPVLERCLAADALIFGSPIYFGDITGGLRSFMERLLFPNFVYDANYSTLAPKRMPIAFVYTMNLPEERMQEMGYPERLGVLEFYVGRMFVQPQRLFVCNTYQFDDYSKYKMEVFSEEEKARHRERQFPEDLKAAFALGAALAGNAQH